MLIQVLIIFLFLLGNEMEKNADEIIENNLRNYYNYQNGPNEAEENNNNPTNNINPNIMNNKSITEDVKFEENLKKTANAGITKNSNFGFEKIDMNEFEKERKSHEYEDVY
jgi:hypothetical protein